MAAGVGRVKLGSQGLEVSAIGLGYMGMPADYGPPKPDEDSIKFVRYAFRSGVTHVDIDGLPTNEILIGKAVKGLKREKVQLATKLRMTELEVDGICGDPEYVRDACEASLKCLDVDYIDLFYAHRIDPSVPIEFTMGELKKLVEEGKIKYIGLSEASASTIRRAHAVHPITAVQLDWSLWTRGPEIDIIPICRELGIGIVPFGHHGRGFFPSGPKLENFLDYDITKDLLCFERENLGPKKTGFERVVEIGQKKGFTPEQLALAWLLHQGSDVGLIPGSTDIENLKRNIGALSVRLSRQDMVELESIAAADT